MQLQSYAIHADNSVLENMIDFDSERGYSLYIFDATSPSGYCVLTEESDFSRLRILLAVAFGILEPASVFIIPLLMAGVRDKFKNKCSGTMRCFTVATVMVIIILVVLFYLCNIRSIYAILSEPIEFSNTKVALVVLTVTLVVFPLFDIVAAGVLVLYKYIKSPEDKHCCSRVKFRHINNQDGDTSPVSVLWLRFHFISVVCVTVFFQLLLFNLTFVSMAAVAAPIQVGSLLIFYCTSLFCFTSFLALVLKVLFRAFRSQKGYKIFAIALIFLSVFVLAGIVVFCVFLYYYTILKQEYRNDRGVLTFLGALLPSALVTGMGAFLTWVISHIQLMNRADDSDRSENSDEQNEQNLDGQSPDEQNGQYPDEHDEQDLDLRIQHNQQQNDSNEVVEHSV